MMAMLLWIALLLLGALLAAGFRGILNIKTAEVSQRAASELSDEQLAKIHEVIVAHTGRSRYHSIGSDASRIAMDGASVDKGAGFVRRRYGPNYADSAINAGVISKIDPIYPVKTNNMYEDRVVSLDEHRKVKAD